jgi:hypothetical protein
MTALARRRFNEETSTIAMKTEKQIAVEIISDQLRRIDARLASIELELATHIPDAVRAELIDERTELSALRRINDIKLRDLNGPGDPAVQARAKAAEENRQRAIAQRERTYRENCIISAEQCAKEGDTRQARIWRMESLRAREYAERELR